MAQVSPFHDKVELEAEQKQSKQVAVTGPALYGRMLLTGCCKCILPIAFILMSKPVAESMGGKDEMQEQLEQIAGGLLIYTFAYGCWGEIMEQFEKSAGDVGGQQWWVYALAITITLLFSPLFYIVFENQNPSVPIFDFGVTGSAEAVCPEHPSVAHLNFSAALCSCSQARKGTAGSPTCAAAAVYSMMDLAPYLIGFALDGMVLVLLEGDEEMFSCGMIATKEHRITIFFTVFLKPIMFALDNVLTGTAMASTLVGVSVSTGIGVWPLYILNCSFCIIGVIVAMFWHFVTSFAPHQWKVLLRLAFMTLAALSFLDNGLDMIRNGITFYVGMGFVVGWVLKLLGSLVDDVIEPYFAGKPTYHSETKVVAIDTRTPS
uniref:Uncharacterized protein n=1 Tax=Haptolina brevifila TaxID=156173 RepID=A0A7S2MXR9_9EUKA|mmetsp:Transcript_61399/g.121468  ORF Transcript_61399/g.121468 Transcript_61399/m.121468 type:complete len:376 (+) Transcript_61399:179-1306(+)|eukprot:CAMPEP_0174699498 /NCGR_PEP_ID=MMETSP1094-20130205/4760_1 /TAXON_ID=156173 /ORGANISM="Chrysochromulina brevifilum, Strain UTEX LB 985" /LENGTH=375 /DNA_ID=CAMNT_0015896853 /DNA_START=97 /DNA_END=1224 /DNA_ORIENTATION=-